MVLGAVAGVAGYTAWLLVPSTVLIWASGWEHHGNVPEQAYALLGQGRCLVALEDSAAGEPLRQAAKLFSSMGYRPALAETEALIAQTTALAS
jgi:hypothetical protein